MTRVAQNATPAVKPAPKSGLDLFNAEIDAEKNDAAFLASVRGQVLAILKGMRIEGIDGDQEA